jgi:hypothetical protein
VADGAGTVSGGPLFDRRRRVTFRPARRIGPGRRDLRRSAPCARAPRSLADLVLRGQPLLISEGK